eukprot:GILJ01009333.1.p1 GENE.GILJ01009333.1~~GILJ01009333.1.p1  ORF type:complete len:481 (-),score=46.20 GILJ01009333.1:17-1414(-)
MADSQTPWSLKLSYALGFIPLYIAHATVSSFGQFYWTEHVKLSPALIGLAWTVYNIFGAIIEPVLGMLSDATNTRFGKRIPWILLGLVPFVFSFKSIWLSPSGITGQSDKSLFVTLLVALLSFAVSNAMILLNWSGMFQSLFKTESDRASTSVLRQICCICGLLTGMVASPILSSQWKDPDAMSSVLCVVLSALVLPAFFLAYASPTTQEASVVHRRDHPLSQLRLAFSNPSFRWLLIATFFINLGNSFLSASFSLYSKYIANLRGTVELPWGQTIGAGAQTGIVLASFYVCGLFTSSFWTYLTKAVGACRAWRYECLMYGFLLLYFFFCGEGFYSCLLGTSLVGLFMSGFMVFPDLLLSAVIDEDSFKSGFSRGGLLLGIRGIVIRTSYAFQSVVSGFILSMSGYSASHKIQTPRAIGAIYLLTVFLPAVCIMSGFFILRYFPLQGESLKILHDKIQQLQKKKQ